MKEIGLYHNTMFVLYGDHYGISSEYEPGVLELLNKRDSVFNTVSLNRPPTHSHTRPRREQIGHTWR